MRPPRRTKSETASPARHAAAITQGMLEPSARERRASNPPRLKSEPRNRRLMVRVVTGLTEWSTLIAAGDSNGSAVAQDRSAGRSALPNRYQTENSDIGRNLIWCVPDL